MSSSSNDAASYRVGVAINKIRAGVDPLDASEQKLRAYQDAVPPAALDAFERAPHLIPFLLSPGVSKVLSFLALATNYLRQLGSKTARRSATVDENATSAASPKKRGVDELTKPTIFIDVTAAHRGLVHGGIKRVCLKIAEALSRSGDAQPVILHEGRLYAYDAGQRTGEPKRFAPNDMYVILDAFWDPFDEYRDLMVLARSMGVTTAICIHDALPILKPGLVVDAWAEWFDSCLAGMLPHADFVISVSRASADEIAEAIKAYRSDKLVTWFHLGADAFERGKTGHARLAMDRDRQARPSFVSVGTLEPKKGYDCALDAFEILWSRGIDVTYTIIGRPGWLCAATARRIERHPDYGRRLFWLKNASDEDVEQALRSAYCYIQASLAEGFGLPIVEAAAVGLPVIASDLPVFKEICIDDVLFFPVCDAAGLADTIMKALNDRPRPAETVQLSWDESARGLVDALRAGASQRAVVVASAGER